MKCKKDTLPLPHFDTESTFAGGLTNKLTLRQANMLICLFLGRGLHYPGFSVSNKFGPRFN